MTDIPVTTPNTSAGTPGTSAGTATTSDIQRRALAVLVDLDRVLRSHHVPYVLIDGTLLGAVRHRGFIPWDDDIDIAMLRPDFERFLRHWREWLPAHLDMQGAEVDPDTVHDLHKVMDARTTIIERMWKNQLGGVWVDILILEAQSEKRWKRRLGFAAYKVLRELNRTRNRDPFRRGRGPSSWWPLLLRRLCSRAQIQRLILRLRRAVDPRSTRLVGIMNDGERGCVPREMMEPVDGFAFEGHSFFGPRDARAYLASYFGDYMTLPPEGHRRIHRPDYVNLDLPFREYRDTRRFR